MTTNRAGKATKPPGAPAGQAVAPDQQEIKDLLAMFNQGRFVDVENLARSLTVRYPQHGFSWKALGTALQQQGRIGEALGAMQTAARLLPGDVELLSNLGGALHEQGRHAEAEATLRRALEIKPDHPGAYNNLGNILRECGRLSEAEACYRRTLELNSDNVDAQCNLGVVLKEQGRFDEGAVWLRRVLSLQPNEAVAYNNLGTILKASGRLSDAETCYRKAVELKPGYAEAHNNLGSTLKELYRPAEAEISLRRALALKPDFAEAYCNLGTVLKEQERFDEAVESFRRAISIKPDYEDAFSNLLFTLNYHPDKSAEEIFAAYREYDLGFGLPLRSEWRAHAVVVNAKPHLKVGYVSPDFRLHAVRHFLEPLLAHHDKTSFELHAYAELSTEDEVTARYKKYVEHWVPTAGMSDAAVAERIRADGIDILVDLAGHTAHNRLGVFARKPAPVSVSWLGYGYTTGLTAIDYLLTDEVSAPPGSEHLFSEQPWRVAVPGYVYRPAEGMGEVGTLPAAQRGYVTFGTLTRAVRINYRTIRAWSQILKRVEGSRLVIDSGNFSDPAMQEALAAKFAAKGVCRERLSIGYHSPPWDVLRGIDIGLDCFPHNSGTTLIETLYMGIPYVTLAGRPSVGRLGSTILVGAGHPEWIAGSEEEYIEKAVALAADMQELAALRAGLRAQLQAGPLMDEPAFARKVEAAFRQMAERAGLKTHSALGPLDGVASTVSQAEGRAPA